MGCLSAVISLNLTAVGYAAVTGRAEEQFSGLICRLIGSNIWAMSAKRKIIIVDDDDAVRGSLEVLLEAEDFQVEAFASATSFLEASFDGVHGILLDVRLQDGDGIDILHKIIAQNIPAGVIVMTGHGDVPMAVRSMRIGASDFIEKPFSPETLLQSIERAVQKCDKAFLSADNAVDAQQRLARLTPRETEVMLLLVKGCPNKIIAHELGLSPRTVEVHRARVMEKTKVQSLSELVRLAIAAGADQETPT